LPLSQRATVGKEAPLKGHDSDNRRQSHSAKGRWSRAKAGWQRSPGKVEESKSGWQLKKGAVQIFLLVAPRKGKKMP